MSRSNHNGGKWRRRRGVKGMLKEYRETGMSVGPRDFCSCCTNNEWCRIEGKKPHQKILKKIVRRHQNQALEVELVELHQQPADDYQDYLMESWIEQDNVANHEDSK